MKITNTMQIVAVDILQEFCIARNMEDVSKIYDKIFEKYNLCKDPFTGFPCTPKEYYASQLEYERHTMIERYI